MLYYPGSLRLLVVSSRKAEFLVRQLGESTFLISLYQRLCEIREEFSSNLFHPTTTGAFDSERL
jgi:hypothetical protein